MRNDGMNRTEELLRNTVVRFSRNQISGEDLPYILEWIAALARMFTESMKVNDGEANEFDVALAAGKVAKQRLDALRIDLSWANG